MSSRRLPRRPGSAAQPSAHLDQLVLTTLYTTHSDAVRRFVRSYVSDPQRVEDVVQETFLRAWKKIGGIDVSDGNPRSFLFTIARNVLVDQSRARARRPELVVDEDRLTAVPTNDDVAQILEKIVISESLRGLSLEHREVIKALYFDDLTVAQAADRLNVAVGTIKSRSYYAVRALRAAFDETGLL